jgi:hypothetical protein
MNRFLMRRLTGTRFDAAFSLSAAAPLLFACTALTLLLLAELRPAQLLVLGVALALGWAVLGAVAWTGLRRRPR